MKQVVYCGRAIWSRQKAEGTKGNPFVPSKSWTPGTTVTVAFFRIWRSWRRYRRPALSAGVHIIPLKASCQEEKILPANRKR